MIREGLSVAVNRAVALWGSPWGVALTALVCVIGHAWLTAVGYLVTPADHYIAGLSELAIVSTALILHAGIVGDKATHLKLDAQTRALDGADDRLVGAEDLPEREIDALKHEVHDVHAEEPP